MSPHIFVSVIVPVHNEERLLSECLESLVNQDYPKDRLEIIVVDNDSTDLSREVIRRYPVRYLFQKKKGAASARNAGAQEARGDLLAFIDSDCTAPRDWVSQLASVFQDDQVDLAGGDCLVLSGKSLVEDCFAFRGFYSQEGFFSPSYPFPPWLMTGNLMVRRTRFEAVGGFEETLLRGEDIDFSWKIAERGGHLKYLPDVRVLHRRSSSLMDFYTKNLRDGKASFVLERRHAPLFSQWLTKQPKLLGSLSILLHKLKGRAAQLFFTENNLSLYRKLTYLFMAGTGHLVFLAGRLGSRIRYEVVKKPLPVPLLERPFELSVRDLQPEIP